MGNIKIPDGMLKAAEEAGCIAATKGLCGIYPIKVCLEAALRWLSENPIVPTEHQLDELYSELRTELDDSVTVSLMKLWQRRMFLAPDPDEPIRDLLKTRDDPVVWTGNNPPDPDKRYSTSDAEVQRRVREAYRRGKEGK